MLHPATYFVHDHIDGWICSHFHVLGGGRFIFDFKKDIFQTLLLDFWN